MSSNVLHLEAFTLLGPVVSCSAFAKSLRAPSSRKSSWSNLMPYSWSLACHMPNSLPHKKAGLGELWGQTSCLAQPPVLLLSNYENLGAEWAVCASVSSSVKWGNTAPC